MRSQVRTMTKLHSIDGTAVKYMAAVVASYASSPKA
jgi:hypothetical protein